MRMRLREAIAEQVDAHADKAITALTDERLDVVKGAYRCVKQNNRRTRGRFGSRAVCVLSDARELPSAQEVAESVDIDPTQFEMAKRQLTQGVSPQGEGRSPSEHKAQTPQGLQDNKKIGRQTYLLLFVRYACIKKD